MNSYCDKIRPLLSEYVDGALDPRRSTELEQHLPGCADCREIVADFRANKNMMGSLPLRQTSAAFDAALAARLAAINQPPARRSWLSDLADAFRPSRTGVWRPALATVAVVGVVTGSVFLFQRPARQPANVTPAANTALIQQCVVEHRNFAETQPLTDFSAQTLADQVDASQADM